MEKVDANALGSFRAAKRLELHLSQREVAEVAETKNTVVSGVETGRLRPSSNLLDKLSKVLQCQIPQELIPPPRDRRGPGYRIERETALGKFVTTRRLELRISQAHLAKKMGVSFSVVTGIELGTYQPGSVMLERVCKALECEIPVELIPAPKQLGRKIRTTQDDPVHVLAVHLSDQNLSDLARIKELSDMRVNVEVVRKALKLLRRLLEKQSDGYAVSLRKDQVVVDLEFLF